MGIAELKPEAVFAALAAAFWTQGCRAGVAWGVFIERPPNLPSSSFM
jgi:hypothetical protein